jgi:hypothetical protein
MRDLRRYLLVIPTLHGLKFCALVTSGGHSRREKGGGKRQGEKRKEKKKFFIPIRLTKSDEFFSFNDFS